MIKKVLFILLVFTSLGAFSQKYSRVKIYTDGNGLKQLAELGVAVDHGEYKRNTFFISDFSDREINVMRAHNFNIEILIDDVKAYFIEQNKQHKEPQEKNVSCPQATGSNQFVPQTPSNFNHGSMGGYLTYNEMLAELDAMAAQYPNLITIKTPISTFLSRENRPIYHVVISDNPNTDESGEPKVLYTAIHHAREPMSLMETIFYMWYLLENYNTSNEIQYLVNNTQLYFVPCINPDGYLYNESTDPAGGGMWRKNRRNNGDGTYGVDLNRNYSYGWGTTGTTNITDDETYCGTSAFSEPEVQAMRWLVQNNHFIMAFNAHTYSKDILFPIGTTVEEVAPHHDYFQAETNHMVQYNGYTAMKSSGLYPCSGDSDDYMYKSDVGIGQKDTIFAHTPEVGTQFWQPENEIEATCKEMVFPNLVLAHITRNYVVVKDIDPSSIETLSGNFTHSAYRLGLMSGPVTVSIEPLLNVVSVGNSVVYNLALKETQQGTISFLLNPAIQYGEEIKYVLLTDNGFWVRRDTIVKIYGAINLQATEDGTASNWFGTWGTTTEEFVSPSQSYTDSPNSTYSDNANTSFMYVPTIDLTNATAAMISYYAKWNIETDFDYVQFQVSVDNGITWVGQCTKYTVPGTNANGSVQPNNKPVYEGVKTEWVLDEVNLSDYLGQTIKVRFVFKSDAGMTYDGFYFDDFKIYYTNSGDVSTPVAFYTVSDDSACVNQSLAFTDYSSNFPTSWAWDFGDGATSTFQSPSHGYSTPGTYVVTLITGNSAGSDTVSLNVYVQDCASIDNLIVQGVSLQPNPNHGVFLLKGLDPGSHVSVYDLHGKLIHVQIAEDSTMKLKLEGINSGIYYLKTTQDNQEGQLKFAVY